ncbi:hypothetical protein HMSSN036_36670 [Paenibacillus macerans]|nr:hypothetical protein HMSSN036_36670 [Paenibacillus macerans]
MDMNQYLSMFIDESNDHLQSLNEKMLELESNPDDISIVQVIFRSAHTLKGMAATMGFEDLSSLTHQMENVLDLVRNEKLKNAGIHFDTLFRGLDALQSMVEDITQGGEGKADVSSIVADLQSIVRGDLGRAAAPTPNRRRKLKEHPLPVRSNWTSTNTPFWSSPSPKGTKCCMSKSQFPRIANSRRRELTWCSTCWNASGKS